MDVQFREVDPFNFWIWIRFADEPSQGEKNYVDGIFDSWYVLGKLGGFNSENLQCNDHGTDLNWLSYSNETSQSVLPALMHNIGELEYQGKWARCWIDLGTSDAISIDVLINAFNQIDSDLVKVDEIIIGGVNEDWPVDQHPDAVFHSEK